MPPERVSLPLGNLSTRDVMCSNSLWGSFRALFRRGVRHVDARVQKWQSNSELDSLFVVALPRSLSSIIYQAARRCLALQEPRWTSDGEFLNADRFVLIPASPDVGQKYITRGSDGALFPRISEFADQIVVPRGFAYKDVVQPFLIQQWLKSNPFPVLKVKRNVADVALSMLAHHWHYPARLFPRAETIEMGVVQGLLRAQDALDSIVGIEVDFDALIADEEYLYCALASLYGERVTVKKVKYIDSQFKARAEQILGRRATQQYGLILDCISRARLSIA